MRLSTAELILRLDNIDRRHRRAHLVWLASLDAAVKERESWARDCRVSHEGLPVAKQAQNRHNAALLNAADAIRESDDRKALVAELERRGVRTGLESGFRMPGCVRQIAGAIRDVNDMGWREACLFDRIRTQKKLHLEHGIPNW